MQVVNLRRRADQDRRGRSRTESETNEQGGIPHICQFWYTATLFRLVKIRQYVRKYPEKIAKTGQNYAFSLLKSTPAREKYTTGGCVVVTNMSYNYIREIYQQYYIRNHSKIIFSPVIYATLVRSKGLNSQFSASSKVIT